MVIKDNAKVQTIHANDIYIRSRWWCSDMPVVAKANYDKPHYKKTRNTFLIIKKTSLLEIFPQNI